jgi:hypothetical protein
MQQIELKYKFEEESMRKLASIKTISAIQPIEGKDRIELVIVDGWQIIVKKGEYHVGDKTVFIEIDSILPAKPEFEFLRSKNFRIKTMKLSGVLSQGICFPLSTLPQDKEYNVEDDVTEIMGIVKYEPNVDNSNIETKKEHSSKFNNPIFKFLFKFSIFRKILLHKKQNKGFPEFISKTDEPRIQNMPFVLNNQNIKYIVREKIDGQSGTFFLKKMHRKWVWQKRNFDFGVCSRNLRLWNETDSSYWSVVKKYNIKSILEDLIGDNDFVAIQGECIAQGVQGNKYKVAEPDLYVFNLIYPNGKVLCLEAEKILKKYGLKWCPLIDDNFTALNTVNAMLDYATSKSMLYDTLREGIVIRNYEKNISFKVVSPEFLIKNDE